MTEVLRPPFITNQPDNIPMIFLAGPIQGAPNWQQSAIEIIGRTEDLLIACPRKDYEPGEFVYEAQVDWETHHLRRAARRGVVMFWLARQAVATPGRAYAQTSRFELGEWKVNHQSGRSKLVVGIEDGFGNEHYIRRRLGQDCPDITVYDSLEGACRQAVEEAFRQ